MFFCKPRFFANLHVIMSLSSWVAGAGRDRPFEFKSPKALCLMLCFCCFLKEKHNHLAFWKTTWMKMSCDTLAVMSIVMPVYLLTWMGFHAWPSVNTWWTSSLDLEVVVFQAVKGKLTSAKAMAMCFLKDNNINPTHIRKTTAHKLKIILFHRTIFLYTFNNRANE